RLPGEALAVARDELAVRREDDGGVGDRVAGSLVHASGYEPESCLARERSQPLGQLARHVNREVERRGVFLLEQRRQRHQVELRRDDELQPVEGRAERADVPLELSERGLAVAGDTGRL